MNWGVPSEQDLRHVAANMRSQDRNEVALSHGATPEEAAMASWVNSVICRSVVGGDGSVLALAGVTPDGTIWLLATYGLLATRSRRRQFARGARVWVDMLVATGWPVLHNVVPDRNRATLRWLESMGFRAGPAVPMGPGGALFRYVERKPWS